MKAGRILLFACLFLWTGVSAWAMANPENRCSRVAAGAISNARYYDPELGRFIQPDTEIPDLSNPQSYNRYSYCVNDPLRYNDPTGHGPVDDALFNTETLKSSYQLMTMHDTFSQKLWEVPVGVIGMAAGTADAAFNVASLGGKGVVEGGAKELIKTGVEELGKEAGEKTTAKILKSGAVADNAAPTAVKQLTVIGHLPDYVKVAESKGANYLKPSADWNWQKQGDFIKDVIKRGDDVLIGTPIRPGESVLRREVKQLVKAGYEPAEQGSKLLIKKAPTP